MNSCMYTLICFALWFADSRSESEKKGRSGAACVLFTGKLTPLSQPSESCLRRKKRGIDAETSLHFHSLLHFRSSNIILL